MSEETTTADSSVNPGYSNAEASGTRAPSQGEQTNTQPYPYAKPTGREAESTSRTQQAGETVQQYQERIASLEKRIQDQQSYFTKQDQKYSSLEQEQKAWQERVVRAMLGEEAAEDEVAKFNDQLLENPYDLIAKLVDERSTKRFEEKFGPAMQTINKMQSQDFVNRSNERIDSIYQNYFADLIGEDMFEDIRASIERLPNPRYAPDPHNPNAPAVSSACGDLNPENPNLPYAYHRMQQDGGIDSVFFETIGRYLTQNLPAVFEAWGQQALMNKYSKVRQAPANSVRGGNFAKQPSGSKYGVAKSFSHR